MKQSQIKAKQTHGDFETEKRETEDIHVRWFQVSLRRRSYLQKVRLLRWMFKNNKVCSYHCEEDHGKWKNQNERLSEQDLEIEADNACVIYIWQKPKVWKMDKGIQAKRSP